MRLADTTFLIDLARGKDQAIAKANEIGDGTVFCTELSVYELAIGAHLQHDPEKKLGQIHKLLSNFEVLPLTREAALSAGKIAAQLQQKGEEIGDVDCLIAGIALSHQVSTIITRNKKHFEKIPGIVVEPY
jgi:tRNA(fMet)-specific endonuclease VapC